jgi:hypothetical protein
LLLSACWLSFGQTNVLTVAPPPPLKAKAGTPAEAKLMLQLRPGYHVNSNTPSDEYLIPLKLTWAKGTLEPVDVVYPKPRMEKYSFSEKPLSVFSGQFELTARFKTPATANTGPSAMQGKLRYQACDETMCLPPKTIDVNLQVDITK